MTDFPFDPGKVREQIVSQRWTSLIRTDLEVADLAHWDPGLLRDTRVLVPVDVQALYVPAEDSSDGEPMVRLPFALTGADDEGPPDPVPPFADGAPRPAGVHLHWAPPDALLRGQLDEERTVNRLGLPALPDRWLVLRITARNGEATARTRGWVLEADTARAVPLEAWPERAGSVAQEGRTVPAGELNGSVGGGLTWLSSYDAVRNRFSFHDPLDDVPSRLAGNQASYLVTGWWSRPELDPLDGAHTTTGLEERLRELRWHLELDEDDDAKSFDERLTQDRQRRSIGLDTAGRYGSAIELAAPIGGSFVDQVSEVRPATPNWPRTTLVHGVVHGVPMSGRSIARDLRPRVNSGLRLAMGTHGDDAIGALVSSRLEATTAADRRRETERILAAFTGHLLDRLGSPDGLVDVAEHEHAAGFGSRPGGDGATERLQTGRAAGGTAVGRAARSKRSRLAAAKEPIAGRAVRLTELRSDRVDLRRATGDDVRHLFATAREGRPEVDPDVEVAEVIRPGPRFHLAVPPSVAISGASRSLRHGGDGRFSADGLLRCRWPSQVGQSTSNVLDGAEVLSSLGNGAVPPESLALAREVITQNPYLASWRAAAAAAKAGGGLDGLRTRFQAESVLRFGPTATYDGGAPLIGEASGPESVGRFQLADQLRRYSLVGGVDPDPVGVTPWAQPWIPMWFEWEAEVEHDDDLAAWELGPVDLEPGSIAPAPLPRFRGRTDLTIGPAVSLSSAITEYLKVEDARDRNDEGEIDDDVAAALGDIAGAVRHLDLLGAQLDGLRERQLGVPFDGGLLVRLGPDGEPIPLKASGDRPLVTGGRLRLTRARVIDTFGRTLELPVDRTEVPVRDRAGAGDTTVLLRRPRLTLPARLLFRFVDPGVDGPDGPEAFVDQVEPSRMVNPVSGFLLPDHIDEALEVFDAAGNPIGQVMHEPIGGGVTWEIAPGRPGPTDAGPGHALGPAQRPLALVAAGLVGEDARVRQGRPADRGDGGDGDPPPESTLSALLRAIDTTLWSVDAFSGFGSEHIAGLVGRPIAVVRARVRLDLDGEYGIDPEAAIDAIGGQAIRARLGDLTRTDDGLLGYFVDDDYTRFRIVDKVVAGLAFDGGRRRGQLGRYGESPTVPAHRPIEHPYVVAEDELILRPGRTVLLTLLLHPAGRVHLTSGLLPRKSLQLARDWVQPGLARIAPSARIGPVLVDPAQIRLPRISSFPETQVFTRRDTPGTWRDDPILAATQAALLPELPHQVEEGYIRILPTEEGP